MTATTNPEKDTIRQLRALNADLLAALEAIRHELGVPGPGYPAPVANAVAIAQAAIAKAKETA